MIHGITALQALGAKVSDVEMELDHRGLRDVREASVSAWVNEFREDWEGFLPSLTNRSVNTLEELINFNDRHAVSDAEPLRTVASALSIFSREMDQVSRPAYITSSASETLYSYSYYGLTRRVIARPESRRFTAKPST